MYIWANCSIDERGVRWMAGDYVDAERRKRVSSSVTWDKSLRDATLYNLFLPLWLPVWLQGESNDRSEKIMGLKCDEKERWKNKRCLHLFFSEGMVDVSVWENVQMSAPIAVIYSDPEITDTLNDLYYNMSWIKCIILVLLATTNVKLTRGTGHFSKRKTGYIYLSGLKASLFSVCCKFKSKFK